MADTLNPVGKVHVIPGFDALIEKMKETWINLKAQTKTVAMPLVTKFLTQCLDDMIIYLVEHDIPGADKKATVIAAIGVLYDIAITGALPIFLRPFSGWVKNYIVNVQMSHLIDWIVDKYESGTWSHQTTVTVLSKYGLHD